MMPDSGRESKLTAGLYELDIRQPDRAQRTFDLLHLAQRRWGRTEWNLAAQRSRCRPPGVAHMDDMDTTFAPPILGGKAGI